MFKRLCVLAISLILGGVVLYVGRMNNIDDQLISIIYYGIMAVAFVIYAVDAAIEFKKELHGYEGGVREHKSLWENIV